MFQTRETPEFWPENKSPFYSLDTGERSCYSHVVMAGLEAFIRAGGEPDTAVYTEVIRERFGEGKGKRNAKIRWSRWEKYPLERRPGDLNISLVVIVSSRVILATGQVQEGPGG